MKDSNDKASLVSVKNALITVAGLGLYAFAKSIYKEMTRYEWQDKVVLITGGSRGLGLAIARELAVKGARLVICSRNREQLDNAKEQLEGIGAEVLAIETDLTNQVEVRIMIETAIRHFGQINVLINNAGTISVGPENVMEVEEYERVMDINFWAVLYTIKAVLPHFAKQGGGKIVNICSIGGKISVPHLLPYSVSKFALVGLSEGLCVELKKDNIQVTTVIPNLMQTGSPRNVSVKGDHEAEYAWFKIAASSPLLSQKAEVAAKQIVKAAGDGNNEVILTQTAKIAVAIQGLMPEAITSVSQLANRFLPKSTDTETKKGYESESEASVGPVASLSDKAAVRYNEI